LFQQSARAAIETTVLYADVRRVVVNPSPNVACLPRWSSAPARLASSAAAAAAAPVVGTAAATEGVETTAPSPRLEPDVRRKLQTVFSLDVGVLARSQEHQHQQQQQQQQRGGSDDITTQL